MSLGKSTADKKESVRNENILKNVKMEEQYGEIKLKEERKC